MNLKDLKYLVALADTGHFGKAAERTFVSQPTLSAQLKKLEEYLGVQLIERQTRGATLTQAGAQIVAGVLTGPHTPARMRRAGATHLIHGIAQLPELLIGAGSQVPDQAPPATSAVADAAAGEVTQTHRPGGSGGRMAG